MFNVFVPFHPKMIEGLRKMNRRFLVAQTNLQAIDVLSEDVKDPILLTDYDDIIAAKTHLNAIVGKDKYKYILDLENDAHRTKLIEMLSPDSKYRVYGAFIDDLEKVKRRLNDKYSTNIRNYIGVKSKYHLLIKGTVELVSANTLIYVLYAASLKK